MARHLVRGQSAVASGYLVRLAVLPGLVNRAVLGSPWLFLGARRRWFPAPDPSTYNEGTDEQPHDYQTGDDQADAEHALRRDVSPSDIHDPASTPGLRREPVSRHPP